MENKNLTEERKREILEKWDNGTVTEDDLKEIGGFGELLNLWVPIPDKPLGTRHIYYPGKISAWVD